MEKVAVSACLVGQKTKYDGSSNYNQSVIDFLKDKEYILICPEVFGGLPTPRKPSEIKDNIVINSNGEDVTSFFEKGANKAIDLIVKNNVTTVIVKSNSPSCGFNSTYDGTFTHTLVNKSGVFTSKLENIKNIKILTEKDIENSK